MDKIIEIKNLCKKYYSKWDEVVAIGDINLEVLEGEYVSIVGPSGCGKSTLLNIMLQDDCLFSWLTILDNCLIGLRINNELTDENIYYVKELLNEYGLGDFMDSYPSSLSGGMRQRVLRIRYTHK